MSKTMKTSSINAAAVKKRALISLQRVHDMAATDLRTTAAAEKDDLKFTKKDRSELGGDEPVHGNRLRNRAHDRVDKGPLAVSVTECGPEKNGPEKLMRNGDRIAGPINFDGLIPVMAGNSKYGPADCIGLDKMEGGSDSSILPKVKLPRDIGGSSWASLFGSSSGSPMVYTTSEKIVVTPNEEMKK